FEQDLSPLARTNLMVMIEDTTGCFAMDTILIAVSKHFPFFIPNVFAPLSSNEENSIFRPYVSSKVRKINFLRVFNRWGDVVYDEQNFPMEDKSAGWDGRFNGKLLNSGVFVFFLEVEFIDGSVEVYSGDVTLVR
ncbi:MAG: hypothetical protein DWQ02_02935, partial [Bacteroidetes bacterium]